MDALEILNDLIGAAQVSYSGTAEYKRLKDWDQAITVEINGGCAFMHLVHRGEVIRELTTTDAITLIEEGMN
jgi:hypothetical protein